jgi:hypothetical protein
MKGSASESPKSRGQGSAAIKYHSTGGCPVRRAVTRMVGAGPISVSPLEDHADLSSGCARVRAFTQ